jgi:hypothetical protein
VQEDLKPKCRVHALSKNECWTRPTLYFFEASIDRPHTLYFIKSFMKTTTSLLPYYNQDVDNQIVSTTNAASVRKQSNSVA